MVRRLSSDILRERLKRFDLDLECGRPDREKLCQVVFRVPGAGVANLSPFMSLSETEAWIRGYETCKDGEDTQKIQSAKEFARRHR